MSSDSNEGRQESRAWRASWLSAWLASIGALSANDLKLSFSDGTVPLPNFWCPGGEVIEAISQSVPRQKDLECCALNRSQAEADFPRNPSLRQYEVRAARSRSSGELYLGATVTDLTLNAEKRLEHSPFDPTAPKGSTLYGRVLACVQAIEDKLVLEVQSSFDGTNERIKANGLGFDATRIAVATSTDSDKYVDPVVECLAFQALQLFPVRGRGGELAFTRGWSAPPSRAGAFAWPCWSQPLDWWAVDCLLDEFWAAWATNDEGRARDRRLHRLGVRAVYELIPFRPTAKQDTTRGYSSRIAWTTS